MSATLFDPLAQLAQLYSVDTSYYDMTGRLITASPEALLAVLKSLGANLSTSQDAPSALREKRQAIWRKVIEPVIVLWEGGPTCIELRFPARLVDSTLRANLKLESSDIVDPYWSIAELRELGSEEIEGERYTIRSLPLPTNLPIGYHELVVEIAGKFWNSLIIVSPMKAYSFPTEQARRYWGLFLPLYALHTRKSWGSGDFGDLEILLEWTESLGGGIMATLPLLASFFDGVPPSPYTPASRLFWNEFYVDVSRIPEFEKCPAAQSMVSSPTFQQEISGLRNLSFVDYDRQMALKRKVLELLAECFFKQGSSERIKEFEGFLASKKEVQDYARFRATGEQHGDCWHKWQEPLRDGILEPTNFSESARTYHLYAQWITHQQLENLCKKAAQKGPGIYLDLPLGVHACGYDTWRYKDIFLPDISIGAPPDPVFTSGQNWGFPPMHPEKIREHGYRYFINCIRHHLGMAGMLRIDHVMGFHRLFWIPEGMPNNQGVYVRYHPDEFYAILAIESYRHKSIIVGEDLGMVPPEVRPAMDMHGLYRMYIAQYELTAEQQSIKQMPAEMVASLNTHDMFPFAAFWQEMDVEERKKLGLLNDTIAAQETQNRRSLKNAFLSLLQQKEIIKEANPQVQSVTNGTLKLLSESTAQTFIINLEDLWGETRPQNIPGTQTKENWTRKARYSLEEFSQLPQVTDVLKGVDVGRKGNHGQGAG